MVSFKSTNDGLTGHHAINKILLFLIITSMLRRLRNRSLGVCWSSQKPMERPRGEDDKDRGKSRARIVTVAMMMYMNLRNEHDSLKSHDESRDMAM